MIEVERSSMYLRIQSVLLRKKSDNLKKSVERLKDDVRRLYGRANGNQSKADCRVLAEV